VPGREGDGWGRQVAFRRFRLKMPRKSTEPSMLGDIKRVTGATAAKGKRRGGDTCSLRLSTGIVECINLREIFKVEFSASMVSFEKLFNLRLLPFTATKSKVNANNE